MKHALIPFILALLMLASPATAQENQPVITSPQSGQYVRGMVDILGSNSLPNFASSDLAFSYSQDSTTWFDIFPVLPQVSDGLLGVWNTTSLTDGDYTLQMRVYLSDGTVQEIYVDDIRVRNYTPLPTDTPPPTESLPASPTTTPVPATATPVFPTPTPYPANPLTISTQGVYITLGKGALLAVGLFIFVGLFLRIRRK